jgi:hypothetical protein
MVRYYNRLFLPSLERRELALAGTGRCAMVKVGAEVRTIAGGYTRYTFSDSSEVWLRPNGEVVRLPQREWSSQGQRTNRGMRLDENDVLTALHTTGEYVED